MSSAHANGDTASAKARPFVFVRILPYLLAAIVSGLYFYPFVRVLTWSPDEGIFLYGAQLVTQGAIPSRDFIELYGPGSFYWLGLFFKLFGVSVVTARALLCLTGIATVLLGFHLSRWMGASGIFAATFILATSIPLMVMNSPHYDTNLFFLLSFALFLSARRRLAVDNSKTFASHLLLFLAGMVAGWTSCMIQQKGLYLVAALVLSVLILHPTNRVRTAAMLLGGYSVAILTELSLYAAAGALPNLIYANIILPLSTYSNLNAVEYGFPLWSIWFPRWFSVTRADFLLPIAVGCTAALSVPFLLILTLPVLLPLFGFLSRSSLFRRECLPYWFAAYAMWLSELHRVDIGHLRNGCLLLVVMFFAICETHRKQFPKHLAVVIAACVILNATINLLGATSAHVVIHTRRGTLLAQQRDSALEFLLTHTRPGDNVLVYPYHPAYYFLADVHNPTLLSGFLYVKGANRLFRGAVHDIDVKKVRYVLWDTVFAGENLRSLFPAYHPPPQDKLIIEPYLESHYRQIGFENGFRILQRKQ